MAKNIHILVISSICKLWNMAAFDCIVLLNSSHNKHTVQFPMNCSIGAVLFNESVEADYSNKSHQSESWTESVTYN